MRFHHDLRNISMKRRMFINEHKQKHTFFFFIVVIDVLME